MDYGRIAELYDVYVNTTFDIPFFLTEARKVSGGVLELMSGTGRVSVPLIEAGIRLTCVDKSREMLAIFRRKLKQRNLVARICRADVCKMSLGKKFDLIFIPFHSFAELLSGTDQRKALRSIHHHLSKIGRFICTLHNPVVRLKCVNGKQRLIGEYLFGEDRKILLLRITEERDSATRLVNGVQLYEIYNNKGVLQSKIKLKIRFHLHTRREFEKLVKSEGFDIVALYGDYSYSPFVEKSSPFMIWVLMK